jgi:hypothetical protein
MQYFNKIFHGSYISRTVFFIYLTNCILFLYLKCKVYGMNKQILLLNFKILFNCKLERIITDKIHPFNG